MNTLFYAPGACSLAAHIVLEEIGAPYEAKRISLKDGDNKKPEFLKLNPRGKVPTLKVGDDVVTENVAILTYLADSNPSSKLLPAPGEGLPRTHALEWLAFCTSTVHTAFAPLFGASRMVPSETAQTELTAYAKKNVLHWMSDVDERVRGKKFALGDRFSPIDAYLYVFWRWAGSTKLDVAKLEAYAALAGNVEALPSTKRALRAEDLT